MDQLPNRELTQAERKSLIDPQVGDQVVVIGRVIYSSDNHLVVKFVDDPLNNESTTIIPKTLVAKMIDQTYNPLIVKQVEENSLVHKNLVIEKMVTAVFVRELNDFKQPTEKVWLHNLAMRDLLVDEDEKEVLDA